jgi:hypothetical protein
MRFWNKKEVKTSNREELIKSIHRAQEERAIWLKAWKEKVLLLQKELESLGDDSGNL